jgi:hypothetical protein
MLPFVEATQDDRGKVDGPGLLLGLVMAWANA